MSCLAFPVRPPTPTPTPPCVAGGMWKQPCVASVISEEERLRQAVFEQVYAELCQKDNNQLGFYAQP